jgi:hypothetical protein
MQECLQSRVKNSFDEQLNVRFCTYEVKNQVPMVWSPCLVLRQRDSCRSIQWTADLVDDGFGIALDVDRFGGPSRRHVLHSFLSGSGVACQPVGEGFNQCLCPRWEMHQQRHDRRGPPEQLLRDRRRGAQPTRVFGGEPIRNRRRGARPTRICGGEPFRNGWLRPGIQWYKHAGDHWRSKHPVDSRMACRVRWLGPWRPLPRPW